MYQVKKEEILNKYIQIKENCQNKELIQGWKNQNKNYISRKKFTIVFIYYQNEIYVQLSINVTTKKI